MRWWEAALLLVVVWRVTRLLVVEEFPPTARLRGWVLDSLGRFNEADQLIGAKRLGLLGWSVAYLFTCMWCLSVWIGLAAYWATTVFGTGWLVPVGLVCAASGVTGLLAELEDTLSAVQKRGG